MLTLYDFAISPIISDPGLRQSASVQSVLLRRWAVKRFFVMVIT
jgi:hypothetical protein